MTLSTTDDAAMTATCMATLGQAVTYAGQVDGSASINVIIDDRDALFPGGFDAQGSDADCVARLAKADVENPRRGDTITDAASTVYTVDSYRVHPQSATEWLMEVRRG